MPDTPARAFVRGAQDGALQAHYNSWRASQNVPDSPEAQTAFAKTLTSAQVRQYSADDSAWARSFWKNLAKRNPPAPTIKTMGDVQRGQSQQKQQVEQTKTTARVKAKAQRSAEAGASPLRRTRDTGIPGIRGRVDTYGSARGADTAGELGVLTGNLLLEHTDWGRALLRRAYGTRAVPGRTGAAATRAPTTTATARPNRTGALATRTIAAQTGTALPTGTGIRNAATGASQGVSGRGATGVVGSSGVSHTGAITREAQRGSEQLAALQRQTENQLSAVTQRFISRSRAGAAVRAGTRALSRSLASSATGAAVRGPGAALTPLNAVGVSSAQAQLSAFAGKPDRGCKCPPTRKKSTTPRCRNKVISRRRDGNVLTTKTELTCPPSRPK